eukprot:gnl/TRDRNA2_/TRDRNA2_141452_c0_seq2.p1 gnl/TRDRNA2_/TRDRNA2_141452_c0~~gnl/TRDRNA2_/TRDRNA2_141452_c0_seq2.p1  ORF type:complete len:399 (+),score=54.47 gnl/TRDRNA2_/TRDRNA2_141452_c0_seq2:74-1198(+)
MESHVETETVHLGPARVWTREPKAVREKSSAVTAAESHEMLLERVSEHQRHVLFVGLPLALYVRNTPHLYQVIDRLRSVRLASKKGESFREVLDAKGKPYSFLVYAIMGALQTLYAVSLNSIRAARGLEELAPLQNSPCEDSTDSAGSLMFRGIWVPDEIDEAAAKFQWSFNSFSRRVEGVCHVLNFYAGAEDSPTARVAALSNHVLLLIARRATAAAGGPAAVGGDWAFPVQFFNTPEAGKIEQELLVPPFAAYTFETIELHSQEWQQRPREARRKLASLEERWALRNGLILKEAPLLDSLLQGSAAPFASWSCQPRITVRFVRRINLAKDVRFIFEHPHESLLAFPPLAAAGSSGQPAHGSDSEDSSSDFDY